MSKTLQEELEMWHDAWVKLFDDFIEAYGIKKLIIKILDWMVKRWPKG